MSNFNLVFWHLHESGKQTSLPLLDASFAAGIKSSTVYLAATDAQRLFDAMIEAGIRPSNGSGYTMLRTDSLR